MPFVPELLNLLSDVFVETGTFQGDTINIVANNSTHIPSKIISIEISDIFFNNCKRRFEKNSSIILYKGNSKYDLYDKIKNIDSKITFWLDSHFSATPDVGCDPVTVCPILEELDQIKRHNLNTHTIMIDDIRLMNNSDNKYCGFPVTKEELIKKLYEINPKYVIRYFDDYTDKNDVLVAYIEEKQCIHKYLQKCYTNPQPPGFADFLRGTITLYNFSKLYGYKMLVDGSHPVFAFLENNKNMVTDITNKTEEFLPPLSYEDIYAKLEQIFKSGRSLTIMTNSFYNFNDGVLTNFGNISEDCRDFLKSILTPTIEVRNKLKYVFNTVYNININDSFKVFHIRCGDKFIHNNIYDNELYKLHYNKLCSLIAENENKNEKYVLISDSSIIAKQLKLNIPELLYWDNSKIHLGDLVNKNSANILDTIVDFFIMSLSREIISAGSGFAMVNSIIYNIKYTEF